MKQPEIKIVAFTAGKGGCGKTTLAVNFSYNVYKANKKVLLVDFDLNNRGSSGIFSEYMGATKDYVTLMDLVNNTSHNHRLIQVIDQSFYFIPSVFHSESVSMDDLEKNSLQTLMDSLKSQILTLAEKYGIDCVVIDCFCGIDKLTTAGVGIADDAVLINEPDIVTFTGTIGLFRHLKRSFQTTTANPEFHLVVNKLRSEHNIKDLNHIYRDNLQKEFGEPVSCHFPFHEKIFQNFGKYPFWEDLLPYSLFVKKLKLLSLKIFKGKADHLIRKSVLNWGKAKINRIYFRSVDMLFVDSDFLILRFSSFMTSLGLIMAIYMGVRLLLPVTPTLGALVLLLLIIASLVFFCTQVAFPSLLTSMLNFTQAIFFGRLLTKIRSARILYRFQAISYFINAALIGLASLTMVFLLGMLLNEFRREAFGYDTMNKPPAFAYFTQTWMPRNNSLFNEMNFSGAHIVNLNLTFHPFKSGSKNFTNATFTDCVVPGHFLQAFAQDFGNTRFVDCSFSFGRIRYGEHRDPFQDDPACYLALSRIRDVEGCSHFGQIAQNDLNLSTVPIVGLQESIDEAKSMLEKLKTEMEYFGLTLENVFFRIKDATIKNVIINDLKLFSDDFNLQRIIVFENSTFENSVVYLPPGSTIILSDCRLFDETRFLSTPEKPAVAVPKFILPGEKIEDPLMNIMSHLQQTCAENIRYLRQNRIKLLSDELSKAIAQAESFYQRNTIDEAALADLTELLILRSGPDDHQRIQSLLNVLKNSPDPIAIERALFLRLAYLVINNTDPAVTASAFYEWANWLKGNVSGINHWSWDIWHKYAEIHKLSNRQQDILRSIEYSQLRLLSATDLETWFRKEGYLNRSGLFTKPT
jgi:MinD-like ATPase involved in chromosome partitioning or flagellar assembly